MMKTTINKDKEVIKTLKDGTLAIGYVKTAFVDDFIFEYVFGNYKLPKHKRNLSAFKPDCIMRNINEIRKEKHIEGDIQDKMYNAEVRIAVGKKDKVFDYEETYDLVGIDEPLEIFFRKYITDNTTEIFYVVGEPYGKFKYEETEYEVIFNLKRIK